ncbi:hypothetical protein MTO96_047312 [Rhipicephalus appendiculatus]
MTRLRRKEPEATRTTHGHFLRSTTQESQKTESTHAYFLRSSTRLGTRKSEAIVGRSKWKRKRQALESSEDSQFKRFMEDLVKAESPQASSRLSPIPQRQQFSRSSRRAKKSSSPAGTTEARCSPQHKGPTMGSRSTPVPAFAQRRLLPRCLRLDQRV